MSVLSDIYISHQDEATSYDVSPGNFPERVQYKGLTPLELSTLWAIICSAEWDVAQMDDFICLLEAAGGERLIHRFPAAMVGMLGQLTPDRIQDIAAAWAVTDELSCSPADICPVVAEMARLARLAAAGDLGLYLWNCV